VVDDTQFFRALGQRVRDIRKRKGFSQEDMINFWVLRTSLAANRGGTGNHGQDTAPHLQSIRHAARSTGAWLGSLKANRNILRRGFSQTRRSEKGWDPSGTEIAKLRNAFRGFHFAIGPQNPVPAVRNKLTATGEDKLDQRD
jgi:hypothetical protein